MTSAHGSELNRIEEQAIALEDRVVPSWLRPHPGENRLPVTLTVTAAAVLQATVGHKYGLRPTWLVPALELALLVVLTVINPVRLTRATRIGRLASFALVIAITVDNCVSAGLLDHAGENPLVAAQRELAEEVGLSAGRWNVLVDLFSTPGIIGEGLRVYLARDLAPVDRPEGFTAEGEEAEMDTVWASLDDLFEAHGTALELS